MTASASLAAVVLASRQAPRAPQQPTEAQLQKQIQQSAAEIRRTALENARAQIEAERARLDAQRAQLDAQRDGGGGGVLVSPPPLPAAPDAPSGSPRGIVVTRDGKTINIGGAGDGGVTAQSGPPNIPPFSFDIPHGAVVLGIAFFVMLAFIAVGLPLARAWARRMDRQAAAPPPAPFPSDVTDRLERIEHAVESIAIEVERVSEGQRFTTKLLTDRGEGSAAAAAIPATAQPNDYAGGGR